MCCLVAYSFSNQYPLRRKLLRCTDNMSFGQSKPQARYVTLELPALREPVTVTKSSWRWAPHVTLATTVVCGVLLATLVNGEHASSLHVSPATSTKPTMAVGYRTLPMSHLHVRISAPPRTHQTLLSFQCRALKILSTNELFSHFSRFLSVYGNFTRNTYPSGVQLLSRLAYVCVS